MKCKVKENPVTNKARWWFVLHGNESLLWPQVNLQTSWKLKPCYKPIKSLSTGSNSCPNDNIISANSVNSATSTVIEPSIHDSAGEDNVSVTDNFTSPEFPPPNQSEPTAVASPSLLSSSPERSGSSFLGATEWGNNSSLSLSQLILHYFYVEACIPN